MKNILIIDYNNKFSEELLEEILKIKNLQLFYFQVITSLKNCNLFIDTNLVVVLYLNDLKTLKYICENIGTSNSIIIVNDKNIKIPVSFNKYIYKEFNSLSDAELYNCLNSLFRTKKNEKLNKIISQYLTKLGYNFSLLGTQYLLETIYYIVKNQKFQKLNLNKDVYVELAKQHNVSPHNIKCNITLATQKMSDTYAKKHDTNLLFNDSVTTKSVIKFFILNYCKKKEN